MPVFSATAIQISGVSTPSMSSVTTHCLVNIVCTGSDLAVFQNVPDFVRGDDVFVAAEIADHFDVLVFIDEIPQVRRRDGGEARERAHLAAGAIDRRRDFADD